jgi:DNA-binding transcriptional ArsR family regulator
MKKPRAKKLNDEKLNRASDIIRALAHPLRMKIIGFIDKNKDIHVNKIYNSLKLEQSITSQHLSVLRKVGIVETRREGKFIYYSINYANLGKVIKSVDVFLEKPEEAEQ